jgi:hypothetical protein
MVMCHTPSFAATTNAGVALVAICVNGVDYVSLSPSLTLAAPRVTNISPSCGPITGGTSITLFGSHFYDAAAIG